MKMISIRDFAKATHFMFIKGLCNHVDAKWKHLCEYLMGSNVKELKWKQLFKNKRSQLKTHLFRLAYPPLWPYPGWCFLDIDPCLSLEYPFLDLYVH